MSRFSLAAVFQVIRSKFFSPSSLKMNFANSLVVFGAILLNANAGHHISGREGKCEYYNAHNAMLGNVYSCKIQNAIYKEGDKFVITGNHQSKGRKDLGVKFIEFISSNITQIPDHLWRKFPNIEYVNVNKAGIQTLPQIVNASNLKVILADENDIKTLDSQVFGVSTELETLSFRKNKIEQVDVNAFHILGNLRELYLSDNKITKLHMNTFATLISLEILSLAGNQIQSVDLELLQTNLQLREILLYDNKLTAIHPQTFTSLVNLFNLELHGNLCIDKDIRIDEGDFQELIAENLKECFEGYPSKE